MDQNFARRLDNWRRTVRGGGASSTTAGCCALWAKWYVLCHLQQRAAADVDAQPLRTRPLMPLVSVDLLDGWIVEEAVRTLIDFNERQALRFWYVWQYPPHWICSKLHVRKHHLRLLMARAEKNLQQVLAKLDDTGIIQSNNLHAGVDPRLESKDAPDGGALTLKTEKALIE